MGLPSSLHFATCRSQRKNFISLQPVPQLHHFKAYSIFGVSYVAISNLTIFRIFPEKQMSPVECRIVIKYEGGTGPRENLFLNINYQSGRFHKFLHELWIDSVLVLNLPLQRIISWPTSSWAMLNLTDLRVHPEFQTYHLHLQSIKLTNPYSVYNTHASSWVKYQRIRPQNSAFQFFLKMCWYKWKFEKPFLPSVLYWFLKM